MNREEPLVLGDRKLWIVATPTDLRAGFGSLSALAESAFDINVHDQKDCIAFLSKTRATCKFIFCDARGSILVTRKLNSGLFEQLRRRLEESSAVPITKQELLRFFNGEKIQKVPKSVFKKSKTDFRGNDLIIVSFFILIRNKEAFKIQLNILNSYLSIKKAINFYQLT